ncbi:hypothetical protein [Hyalangium versicolor]|uniref:hypothetical protein n=1 Tax=Hyalangium versicolor TaxID=2861190 RepID=UPI001CCCA25F|nr:hypothetical protein [Hyalangium versicolor]
MAGNAQGQWKANHVIGNYRLLWAFNGDVGGADWHVWAARRLDTNAPALLVRPSKNSVWAPRKRWHGRVDAFTDPPFLALDVDRFPDDTTLPAAADDLDVFADVSTALRYDKQAALHMRSRPGKRPVQSSQEGALVVAGGATPLSSGELSRTREELEELTAALMSEMKGHRERVGQLRARLHEDRTAANQEDEVVVAVLNEVEISTPQLATLLQDSQETTADAASVAERGALTPTVTELSDGDAPAQESAVSAPSMGHPTPAPAPVAQSNRRPGRWASLWARQPYWTALAVTSLAALVLVPSTVHESTSASEPRMGGAARTGLAEEALAEPELMPVGSTDQDMTSKSVVAFDMPSRPFPGQHLAPCRGLGREIELRNGQRACWIKIDATAEECKTGGYEWKGGCYLPSIPSQRTPSSTQPQRASPAPAMHEQ